MPFVIHSKGETAHRNKKSGRVRIDSRQVDLSRSLPQGHAESFFFVAPWYNEVVVAFSPVVGFSFLCNVGTAPYFSILLGESRPFWGRGGRRMWGWGWGGSHAHQGCWVMIDAEAIWTPLTSGAIAKACWQNQWQRQLWFAHLQHQCRKEQWHTGKTPCLEFLAFQNE